VRFGRLPIPPECLPDPPSLPRDWMQTNYWATDSRRAGYWTTENIPYVRRALVKVCRAP
jgi:hypothetical protein